MASNLSLQIKEASRIFRHSQKVKKEGYKKYQGDALEICEKIISDCWNGNSFDVSTGHFIQYYSRDIGWCAPYLIELGYKEELKITVLAALDKFLAQGKITVAITPEGVAFNFPDCQSIDSLAYFIRTLRLCDCRNLTDEQKKFLNSEITRVITTTVDMNTGLIKKDIHISAMKDHAIRESSMYDNTMLAVISEETDKLGIENPLKNFNYPSILIENFWSGAYFYDDMKKAQIVTGDSNIIPFWTGIIKDHRLLEQTIKSIQTAGLDNPFPLKYVSSPRKELKMVWTEYLVPGWEQDTIWSMMGLMYIEILAKIDRQKAVKHLETYKKIIEENKTFVELFDKNGKPYKSLFYAADEGMIWACMFAALSRRI
jgi:hypothetical protein